MTLPRNSLLLVAMIVALLGLAFSDSPSLPSVSAHRMAVFASEEELVKFLEDNSLYCGYEQAVLPGPSAARDLSFLTAEGDGGSSVPTHSETNNQVEGVDELDTVKTDGTYIYTVTENRLVILKAYPAEEAELVSTITVDGTILGLWVNGDKLAILGHKTPLVERLPLIEPSAMPATGSWRRGYVGINSEVSAWIYDIADRTNPDYRSTISVKGGYIGARMIGNFVYIVASQVLPYCGRDLELPSREVNGEFVVKPATQIYYSDMEDYGHSFTNVLGFDITKNGADSSFESFLLGSSSTIYVSSQDLYLTSPSYNEDITVIHRVQLDQETIRYQATGDVHGHVLNQFSMDEYGAYFRVATHSWGVRPLIAGSVTVQPSSSVAPISSTERTYAPGSNVYVLDKEGLEVVGRLEGLGQNEDFHSARFVGGRAYLVTFKKIDPLFVIDLRDPTHPMVLGELKVTGYSDYLQPYDENHLIGIGKEADDQGSFAWYQGVKISLFDVTDPANPREVAKYEIGHRGTQSSALSEHKAVLLDKGRNLLVIPVNVAQIFSSREPEPWAWGEPVWQGAYVFAVSPDGLGLRGRITHLSSEEIPSYENQDRWVSRSLYIENVLYTVSPTMIKMNSLGDLHEIGSVSL